MQNLLHRWDLSWTWNFSGIYNCCGANFGYLCQEMVTCKSSCDHFFNQMNATNGAWHSLKTKKTFQRMCRINCKVNKFFSCLSGWWQHRYRIKYLEVDTGRSSGRYESICLGCLWAKLRKQCKRKSEDETFRKSWNS